MRAAKQNILQRFLNLQLFILHNVNRRTLRFLYRIRGDGMRIFGGEAFAQFYTAQALMAEENEKIDWIWGPMKGRANYLTKSYMPFLLKGPNHTRRRDRIVGLVIEARGHIDELEDLLKEEKDHERALTRFLYRHFGQLELDASEVDAHLDFRKWGQRLLIAPNGLRKTLLRRPHNRIRKFRSVMLQRLEETGNPFSDSIFDMIWFNAGTLGSYPNRALKALAKSRDLQEQIRPEADLPLGQRPKTLALIHEMLRIEIGIPSTNYVRHGRDVEVALIVTGVVDPMRYSNPLEIDLTRDHSDTLAFSGAAKTRGCPAEHFAPDVMTCVLAHQIRSGALK